MYYKELDELFDKLWSICRSITGPGFTRSLKILQDYLPFEIKKIETGTKVFDWTIPQEWELRRATLKTENGEVLVDTNWNNLHVLNFSEPFKGILSYEELESHLYSEPNLPDAVPYVTSYYASRWGLCISDNKKQKLRKDIKYIVEIDTKKYNGALTYGDYILRGQSEQTILISSYLCHPSLANNELSGPLSLVSLYKKLLKMKNRYFTYRFIIVPETIGSISFLSNTPKIELQKIISGMVITCVGGPSNEISFKHSRRHWLGEESKIDNFVESVCAQDVNYYKEREFTPTSGSDERQFCSPAVNLPVIQVAKTLYSEYKEYHTSLDNKSFMNISSVEDSIDKIFFFLRAFELNRSCLVSEVKGGEPMLSSRGLYPSLNSSITRKSSNDNIFDSREKLNLMLSIISLVDGKHNLSSIVEKLNTTYQKVVPIIEDLVEKKIFQNE
jgi:aminopeptidase-like protein